MSEQPQKNEPLSHLDRPLAVQMHRHLQKMRSTHPEPPCGHDELHRQHRLALERSGLLKPHDAK